MKPAVITMTITIGDTTATIAAESPERAAHLLSVTRRLLQGEIAGDLLTADMSQQPRPTPIAQTVARKSLAPADATFWTCPVHGDQKIGISGKRRGSLYCQMKMPDGEWCQHMSPRAEVAS